MECFFYLLFPFLVPGFQQNGGLKIALAALFPLCLLYCVSQQEPLIFLNHTLPDGAVHGLLYTFPLTRLLEFTAGMFSVLLFRRLLKSVSPSPTRATLLEIGAVLLALTTVLLTPSMNEQFEAHGLPWVGFYSMTSLACLIPFTFLISVIAMQRGTISRLLCAFPRVRLGEMSFAIYICHWDLLYLFVYNRILRPILPQAPLLNYAGYLVCLLVVSYLLWRFIDKPCRRFASRALKHSPKELAAVQVAVDKH